jgi:hypothetical protein
MRRVLLGLVAAVVASACFSPDDILIVKGAVTSSEPEGQPVRLLRGRQGESRGDCEGLRDFKETRTDATGAYSFDVFRAQAQSLSDFSPIFCFRLEAVFRSGARARVELPALLGPITLPTLPDWQSGLSLDGDGGVRFSSALPLPADERLEGVQLTHRLEGLLADGGVSWRQDDRVLSIERMAPERVPLFFAPEVLVEDEPVTLGLRARVEPRVEPDEDPLGGSRLILGFEVFAPESVALPPRAAPLSRGVPCPPLLEPCPFTDGLVGREQVVGALTRLSLELPAPGAPRWLVLRGLETPAPLVAVELGFEDGGASTPLQHALPVSLWGIAEGGGLIALPDGGVLPGPADVASWSVVRLPDAADVARVTLSAPLGIGGLGELSLVE